MRFCNDYTKLFSTKTFNFRNGLWILNDINIKFTEKILKSIPYKFEIRVRETSLNNVKGEFKADKQLREDGAKVRITQDYVSNKLNHCHFSSLENGCVKSKYFAPVKLKPINQIIDDYEIQSWSTSLLVHSAMINYKYGKTPAIHCYKQLCSSGWGYNKIAKHIDKITEIIDDELNHSVVYKIAYRSCTIASKMMSFRCRVQSSVSHTL